jgi:hypothetical protein
VFRKDLSLFIFHFYFSLFWNIDFDFSKKVENEKWKSISKLKNDEWKMKNPLETHLKNIFTYLYRPLGVLHQNALKTAKFALLCKVWTLQLFSALLLLCNTPWQIMQITAVLETRIQLTVESTARPEIRIFRKFTDYKRRWNRIDFILLDYYFRKLLSKHCHPWKIPTDVL